MNELKASEVPETKRLDAEGFEKIKPEANILPEQARTELDEIINASREHYDDNGNLYKVGNELVPNSSFDVNGFEFKTDDNGRVISAEGDLKIPEKPSPRDMAPMADVGKGDQIQGNDERFHLIGHQFGGSDGIENLVPGDAKLNHGDYLAMETKLRDAVNDGADVHLKVDPIYENDSHRPNEFRVTYTIDGDKEIEVFRNKKGDED